MNSLAKPDRITHKFSRRGEILDKTVQLESIRTEAGTRDQYSIHSILNGRSGSVRL